MTTKEFPDIKADHIKNMVNNNPTYVPSLGLPLNMINIALAYALAKDIETTKRFLGSTIDVYAKIARQERPRVKDNHDHEFLDAFVKDFAKGEWIYGIVLSENDPNKVENILINHLEMQAFFEETSAGYNPTKVSRTIFTPTSKYTHRIWKFEYNSADLMNIKDFTQLL